MGSDKEAISWRPLKDCLNLGAGNRVIGHAVNVDRMRHRPEINCVWDLNRLPWPWADDSFDHVVAWSVLEHLDIDLLAAMDETWRVIRHRGLLEVKLPYWKADLSYDDPTHRYVVNVHIFDTFDPMTEKGQSHGFYTGRKWRILEVGLNEQETGVVARLVALKDEAEFGGGQPHTEGAGVGQPRSDEAQAGNQRDVEPG